MNNILPSEHVFVAGQTGGGKSFLTEIYLSNFPHVVMLDTKGEMLQRKTEGKKLWKGVPDKEVELIEHLSDLDYVDTPKIIYSPSFEELNEEYYNEFFRWAYFRQNTTVWVDEAMSVSKNSQTIPEFYKAILTRGRSRNTSVWSLTQRPVGLAPIIMSQSTHYFIFNLQLNQDREKVADVTGAPEFYEKPSQGKQKYLFWYFKDGWEHAVKGRMVD